MEHHETKPEDRIPFFGKIIYGLGGFVNNLLAYAIGSMVIVLNLGLGMNPALVGLLGALPRLTDSITDPIMGYISDNTRSRWGRRRPYIFCGAILAGVTFALLWQLPRGQSESYYFWYFLIGSIIFYLAYTMFATPWVAFGYEMTPDYHERTRLMGTQNFIAQLAYVIGPWFLLFMQNENYFDDMVDGAAGLSIIIAAAVMLIGMTPAVFLRERLQNVATQELGEEHSHVSRGMNKIIGDNLKNFFKSFWEALKVKPFLKLCLATFLIFNGFILVASLQAYVVIYYVFNGDMVAGAEYAGYEGSLRAIATFGIIVLITWLATRIGKRRTLIVATLISMIGYASKWFLYTPQMPWLIMIPAPLIAFGFGGLFTLAPAMMADVVDYDETISQERREGMFGSIFWWVVKLGQAIAIAGGGLILNATGFDVSLGEQSAETIQYIRMLDASIPVIASAIAIWAIWSFSLTEEKAHEIRTYLEKTRGPA